MSGRLNDLVIVPVFGSQDASVCSLSLSNKYVFIFETAERWTMTGRRRAVSGKGLSETMGRCRTKQKEYNHVITSWKTVGL